MASLEQFYKQLADRKASQSFYRPAGQAILATPWASERASPVANFGASIAQGLLGGFLNNQAKKEEAQYQTELADVLSGALSGRSVLRPSVGQDDMGLISAFKLFKDRDEYDAEAKHLRELDFEAEKSRFQSGRELQKEFFTKMLEADTPRKKQQVTAAGKVLGFLPKDFEDTSSAPTQGILQPEFLEPEPRLGPELGIPTLREMEDRRIKQLAGEDYENPEIRKSAMVSARAEVDDRRKRARDIYGKDLLSKEEELRDVSENLRLLDEGIEKAGATGSSYASSFEKGLSLLDTVLPGDVFPEAKRQVEGDNALTKVKISETLKEGQKLKGSFSDSDRKFLMEQAPGPDKLREENIAIRNRLAAAEKHLTDRNSFFNYVLDETGGNFDKANQYWKLYSEANPLFDEKGRLREDRAPWQQFDFEDAYGKFLKGESLSPKKAKEKELERKALSAAAPSLPSVGGVYNGQEVVAVRRVR
jgi:hypothetical protein